MADAAAPADALSQAQTQLNANKAASLASIAQAGTAGQQAYQQALQANAGQRTAALNGQLRTLGAQGAPSAYTSQANAALASPYDNAEANLSQMQAARGNFLSGLGATTGAFYDQSTAAIPAMRAAAQNALLNANTKLALAAQQQATNEAIKNIDLQIAQDNLAKQNAPGAQLANTLKGLGSTAAEQGASLTGIGQAQNSADSAAQSQAIGQMTNGFNPGAVGTLGAIISAYPTVDTSNPGQIQGSSTTQGGATTPITDNANAVTLAATVQELNRRLAALGASGSPGAIQGAPPGANGGGSGGIPGVSPDLAAQLYDASSGGRADQSALSAATTAANREPGVGTPAGIRATPSYQGAADAFTKLYNGITAKTATIKVANPKASSGQKFPDGSKVPNGERLAVVTDIPSLANALIGQFGPDAVHQMITDQRALYQNGTAPF